MIFLLPVAHTPWIAAEQENLRCKVQFYRFCFFFGTSIHEIIPNYPNASDSFPTANIRDNFNYLQLFVSMSSLPLFGTVWGAR